MRLPTIDDRSAIPPPPPKSKLPRPKRKATRGKAVTEYSQE